jgi:hypothetical protein
MLAALTDPDRWTDRSWGSTMIAAAADDPAEVLARIAAHHGEIAVEIATRSQDFDLWAARRTRLAVRFARLALLADALAQPGAIADVDVALAALDPLDDDVVVLDPDDAR